MFKPPLVAPYVLVVAGTTAPGIKQGAPSHWWRSKPSLYIGCRNSKKDRKEGSYKNDKNDGGSLLYICWFLFSSIPKSDHPKYPKHGSHRGALTRSPDWVLEYQLPAGLCLARGWGNGVFPIVPMVDVPTAHLGWLTPPLSPASCANWWTGGISWCRSLRKHRFIKLWFIQGFWMHPAAW